MKILFLLLLFLASTRAASWALGWVLSKLPRISATAARVAANLLCFSAFVAWLFLRSI